MDFVLDVGRAVLEHARLRAAPHGHLDGDGIADLVVTHSGDGTIAGLLSDA